MSASERDLAVAALVSDLFDRAEAQPITLDATTEAELDALFSTTTWGIREILLVIVIATLRNPEYRASEAFYDCHPRPLFEGPIRKALLERGVPHRKSGPLNVAKAARGINSEWAAQRRPADAANRVVRLVSKIEAMGQEELERFAVALHGRFLAEANRVSALTVETLPEADPSHLYDLSHQLISRVPDGGNTPQRIVGLLLQAHHEDLQTGINVSGHEDRASTTSTTSLKLGDIAETQPDGTVEAVYEVTVKRFDHQRVREAYESVRANERGNEVSEIVVICRKEDRNSEAEIGPTAGMNLGRLDHQDLIFHFVDIFDWIEAQLFRMSAFARLSFHEKLARYIREPNTAEAVKKCWRELQQ